MLPSFITLLTHLCPRSGSASSSSPGPQVPGAVCPDCQADTACCADAAGVMPASDTGDVDSWAEQVYTDSTIKWQHTFGSLPMHRHEKPVLLTFLWRLIDCSLTQHTGTVCKFPGPSPAQTYRGEVSEKTSVWHRELFICFSWSGVRENGVSPPLLSTPRPGICSAVYLGSSDSKGTTAMTDCWRKRALTSYMNI